MEKEFVPYEEALKLKQLGFDEPCFATYVFKKLFIGEFLNSMSFELCEKTEVFPAPTYSQAFRWFREKYGLIGWVEGKQFYLYRIESTIPTDDQLNCSPFRTHEEAELACLRKLIELTRALL